MALERGTEALLRRLLASVSDEDREELDSLGGDDKILDAFHASLRCWAGVANGHVLFFAGLRDSGRAWMMATPHVARARKTYLRDTREMCRQMQAIRSPITVTVDARYRRSVRWLKWLGFTFGAEQRWLGRTLQQGVLT